MTTTEMRVHMDCAGCESKIKKALRKLKGVDDVDIDMGMQRVTVTGWADQKKVLRTVRKTSRRAELCQFPNNPGQYYDHTNFTNQYYHQHHHGGATTLYASQLPSSSYNYFKHGYDYCHDRGYYNAHTNSTLFGHHTGAASAFSDENPQGCSIM